ncbi:MAG: DNA starvation/stationary phase protection protein [Acidobacteriota bacterium]|nr:DNA starvation/stationary phase protection protein [Blastocatellia bacterium]MDW8411423.1 DNA starvation/stationary phase protection protein [Acidobacteriota bacterium]
MTYEVTKALQTQIANAFLLYANYKKYHWQSYGPLFRDLHLLFDEHAATVLGTIDELGERVRILGGTPVADPRRFTEFSRMEIASEEQTMSEMLRQAAENHKLVIEELKAAVEVATRAADPGSADLFTRLVQIHEKQEWFLREVLRREDGLVA